jgi:hypothetical protein
VFDTAATPSGATGWASMVTLSRSGAASPSLVVSVASMLTLPDAPSAEISAPPAPLVVTLSPSSLRTVTSNVVDAGVVAETLTVA